MGKIFPREIGVSLQINTGQTLTRSVLKFGTDDLDMIHFVPQISPWLKNGKRMYKKLKKKANGVHPKAGNKDVILDADLAGILAHEAIGHTTEADFVMGGSVAGDYLNQHFLKNNSKTKFQS